MNEEIKSKVLDVLAGIALTPFSIAYTGWAFSLVWNWLIVDAFKFLPELSVPQVVGIMVIATFFQRIKEGKSEKTLVESVLFRAIITTVLLFVAWVAKLFL